MTHERRPDCSAARGRGGRVVKDDEDESRLLAALTRNLQLRVAAIEDKRQLQRALADSVVDATRIADLTLRVEMLEQCLWEALSGRSEPMAVPKGRCHELEWVEIEGVLFVRRGAEPVQLSLF
jgi:hypothetical protein